MTMKRFSLAVLLLVSMLTVKAEFTGLTYEVVATTSVGTTYRVYANFDDATDLAQALYAESPFALSITSSAGFYQDALGNYTPEAINPLLYSSFQNLIYDSWITLGQDDSNFPSPIGSVGGAG